MKRSGFTLVELIVVVLATLMVVTFTLAAVGKLDDRSVRVKCMGNLRQIGQAILLYCNDTKGSYPRTKYDPAQSDHPTAYTGVNDNDPFAAKGGPNVNDVSAGLFLLLRTEDVISNVFICPASDARPDTFGGRPHTAIEKSNFPSADFLSYSYADPYPSIAAAGRGYNLVMGVGPGLVVVADMNPGSDILTTLTTTMSAADQRKGNSLNHGGEGQNMLYADGHVEFHNSPLCGWNRDNIYTFGDSGLDPISKQPRPTGGTGILGSPVGPEDSVLLPALNVSMATAAAEPAPLAAAPSRAAVDQGTDLIGWALWILAACILAAIGLAIFASIQKRKTRAPSDRG